MKSPKEECAGPPYWSLETPSGDLQDAVAANSKSVNSSHYSRDHDPSQNRALPSLQSGFGIGTAVPETDFAAKDGFGSELNGLSKDK
jgi:hypothetical protein